MNDFFRRKYGPWAVVTGASDGIGRALAIEVARTGLNVVLVARNEERLKLVSKEIEDLFHVQTKVIILDLSKTGSNPSLFQQTEGLEIGLLCAVAGFGTSGNFLDNSIATELNMLDLNCRAVTEQAHHFGLRFKKRRAGGIILMSSLLAFQGVPGSSNYAATKAYIQSLAEGLNYELRSLGIDVLAAAPGPVQSGFANRADMRMAKTDLPEVVARQILQRLGRKMTVRPGLLSKILGFSLSIVPRRMRVELMEVIMRGMVKHQRAD